MSILARIPGTPVPTLLLPLLLALPLSAQRQVAVGPTGQFVDIQPAINWINATAVNPIDWVIVVNPSGSPYLPFVIDGFTRHQGRISVVSANANRYRVAGPSGQVLVRNVMSGQTTVADLETAYDDGSAAAIRVENCINMVRLRNIDIELRTSLPAALANGVIELVNSQNNMLWDIRLWAESEFVNGYLATPVLGNDGLSGLFVDNGDLQLHQVQLRGYHNTQGPLGYGGDAVRMLTGNRLWLTTFTRTTTLQGGNGYAFGGSCVHALPTALAFVESCGSGGVVYAPGTGPVAGGAYTINNTLPSPLTPPACPFELWGHTNTPTTTPIANTLNVVLATNLPRSYVLYLDAAPFISPAPAGFAELMFLNPASATVVTSGAMGTNTSVPIAIPNNISLAGTQLLFQTVMTPAGGVPQWTFSAPTETTITL